MTGSTPLDIWRLFSLEGRVVAVTGASRGIGQALAIGLASAGADIALIGRTEPTETIEAVAPYGRRVTSIELDLGTCTLSECRRASEAIVAELGSLDVLVNNAGIVGRGLFLDVDPDVAESVIRTDLIGPLRLLRAVGKHMLEARGGSVINIASILASQGGVGVAAYSTAKHGLVGLTRALANEWAPTGVRVNAIAPGYIATSLNETVRRDPSRAAEFEARIPLGRWGMPEDLIGAAVYLSSAASDYVTGSVITVDGGWLAR